MIRRVKVDVQELVHAEAVSFPSEGSLRKKTTVDFAANSAVVARDLAVVRHTSTSPLVLDAEASEQKCFHLIRLDQRPLERRKTGQAISNDIWICFCAVLFTAGYSPCCEVQHDGTVPETTLNTP